VLAESFKFARIYPLLQKDVQENIGHISDKLELLEKGQKIARELQFINPQLDYTPPELITLLFTDVGIFTPAAVSDELIQIFNT